MASPQTENGYTKIANEILKELVRHRFTSYETCVVFHVIRMTYGFNKKEDWISLSQFEIATGISSKHVSRTLSKLLKRKILTKRGKKYQPLYKFNKNYDEWSILPNKGVPNEVVLPKKGIEIPPNEGDTKETITKEIIHTNKMKKNTMGKYREDAPSDSYESVVDSETGEIASEKPKANLNKIYKGMLDWASSRTGKKFVFPLKQTTALKAMREAGISQNEIMNRWAEMENDKFWAEKGFDFTNVANSFDKKR